nr:hypothetical protein B0A51_12039 [Rachicladosporium sp. CCFEE 5018]
MPLFSRKSKAQKAEKAAKGGKAVKDAVAAPVASPPIPPPSAFKSRDEKKAEVTPGAQGARPSNGRFSHANSSTSSPKPHRFTSNGLANSSTDYFSQPAGESTSTDSPNRQKSKLTKERGWTSPHHSADSGYSSPGALFNNGSGVSGGGHSPEGSVSAPMLKKSSLPEMTLGEELAQDPAFAKPSPIELTIANLEGNPGYYPPKRPAKSPGNVAPPRLFERQKSQQQLKEHADPIPDRRSEAPTRSLQQSQGSQWDGDYQRNGPSKSSVSRTNTRSIRRPASPIQEHVEQSADVRWQATTRDDVHTKTDPDAAILATSPTIVTGSSKPFDRRRQTLTEQLEDGSYFTRNDTPEPGAMLSRQGYYSTASDDRSDSVPSHTRGRDPQSYYAESERGSSPVQNRRASQGDMLNHTRQRSNSTPTLSMLKGLKVNKRGKILDEEGDPIGELIDGDIMDCVRQKANAYGEVMDEYGGVVGRVRAIPRENQSPHIGRSESRASSFRHTFMLPANIPSLASYAQSPPPDFSRQRSQTLQQDRSIERLASPPAPEEPLMPFALPMLPASPTLSRVESHASEPMAIELAAEEIRVPQEAYDLSEPFMPPPHVPARSLKRPESPAERFELQEAVAKAVREEEVVKPTQADSAYEQSVPSEAEEEEAPVTGPIPAVQEMIPVQAPVQQQEEEEEAIAPPKPLQLVNAKPSPALRRETVHFASSETRVEPRQADSNEEDTFTTFTKPTTSILRQQAEETATKPQAQQQARSAASRALARSVSEKFIRPPMPPVPEPDTGRWSPTLMAYKGGDQASRDPAVSNVVGAPNRSKPPPLPSFPRQAFTGGLPGNSPFANAGGSVGPLGGPPMNRRVTTNGLPMGGNSLGVPRPALKARFSTHSPLVRSPLSSHGESDQHVMYADQSVADFTFPETTPPESDDGHNPDSVGPMDNFAKFAAHSRAASVRTNASITSAGTGKRTYFTHAGRVTVTDGELPPSATAKNSVDKAVDEAKADRGAAKGKKDEKKKSKLGGMFGKKNKA